MPRAGGTAGVRPRAARHLAAEDGRPGNPGADSGAGRRPGGGDDLRARKYRRRGAGDEAWSVRFRRETAVARKDCRGGAERTGIRAAGRRKPPAAGRTRRAASNPGRERADESATAADRADGADDRARADLRRKRHGQGIGGTRATCQQPARRKAVCRSELRGDSRGADRIGDVRASQGQLHGRERGQSRQVPEGGRRHAYSWTKSAT